MLQLLADAISRSCGTNNRELNAFVGQLRHSQPCLAADYDNIRLMFPMLNLQDRGIRKQVLEAVMMPLSVPWLDSPPLNRCPKLTGITSDNPTTTIASALNNLLYTVRAMVAGNGLSQEVTPSVYVQSPLSIDCIHRRGSVATNMCFENIYLEEGSSLSIQASPGDHFRNIRVGRDATLLLGPQELPSNPIEPNAADT